MRRVRSEPNLLQQAQQHSTNMKRVPSEHAKMHRRELLVVMVDAIAPRMSLTDAIFDPPPEVTVKPVVLKINSSDAREK
jgi:hypothetical protein